MYVLVTPPAVEPVSLDEAKAHCRVEHDLDNALITALAVAARQHFERETNRALVTQTWRLDLDRFPRGGEPIRLTRGPVASISSLAYIDEAGANQTVAAEARIDDVGGDIGRIAPLYNEPWPWWWAGCSAARRINAVAVTFVAGYGVAAAVPELAKVAIKLLVGHWYENRETVVVGQRAQTVTVPIAADAIIASYRIPALA